MDSRAPCSLAPNPVIKTARRESYPAAAALITIILKLGLHRKKSPLINFVRTQLRNLLSHLCLIRRLAADNYKAQDRWRARILWPSICYNKATAAGGTIALRCPSYYKRRSIRIGIFPFMPKGTLCLFGVIPLLILPLKVDGIPALTQLRMGSGVALTNR